VSVPWGEGDCLWVSLSVLRCRKRHRPAAARQDPGSKERAEVPELSSPEAAGVVVEKHPQPCQVQMLLTELRKTLQEGHNRLCDDFHA